MGKRERLAGTSAITLSIQRRDDGCILALV
jgi:hypothetical protein